MGILDWLGWYWRWAGSNIGAMPGCGIAAVIATYLFRKPLLRLWDRVKADMHYDVREDMKGIREVAEAARRIAADTHRHVTGTDHPDAPQRKM